MVVVPDPRSVNPLAPQGEVLVRVHSDEDGADGSVHVAGHVAGAQDLFEDEGEGVSNAARKAFEKQRGENKRISCSTLWRKTPSYNKLLCGYPVSLFSGGTAVSRAVGIERRLSGEMWDKAKPGNLSGIVTLNEGYNLRVQNYFRLIVFVKIVLLTMALPPRRATDLYPS